MIELKIDQEFQSKIPPLTEAEFEQLKENILADGEVYEPIAVWNGVIVDGHNRWKVIQEHPEIPFKIREMDFADKWAAFEWMYKKQLGRRNLTDEQKTYVIGKMYEARKKTSGGQRANDNASKRDAHNGQLVSETDKKSHGVSGEIAMELNIGRNTVRRAEHFAKGIDALKEVSPTAAEMVMQGKTNIDKKDVQELSKKDEIEVKKIATAIEKGEPLKPTTFPTGRERKKEEEYQLLGNHDRESPAVEYTLDDLLEEMRAVNDDFLGKYRRMLKYHAKLISENAAEVATVFTELVTEFEKMEDF